MKSVFIVRGKYLITMNKKDEIIENGAVVVEDGKIKDIGEFTEILKKYKDSSIPVYGNSHSALMPGFINTHTHAAMVLFRGIADDLPLKQWLIEHIWPREAKFLSPEFVYDGTCLASLEILKSGTTTFNDMYFFTESIAEAAKKLGIRAIIGQGVLDFPTASGKGADDYLKKASEFIEKYKDDELIVPAVAPHAIYTCSKETLLKSKELALKTSVPIHIHLSETFQEVEECIKKHGKRPIKYLRDIGFLEGRITAAHSVWVNDEEIELMAEHGVGVSHCIESNLKLSSGIAPVARMIKKGVKVSMGTDGAASNNNLDLLEEISIAAKVQKGVTADPTVLNVKTCMKMLTIWAAESLGLENQIGSIEIGKRADMILMNLRKAHLQPVYDIYSTIIYSAKASDIEDVFVNGVPVVLNGRHQFVDEDEIIEKALWWAEKIQNS
ncbi:5-methylthioadenosine/S-adenosylhomocysteine deaminase [Thermodesulfovibrio aggregans]|uniref:5-methylthioadenosine/S-adenosylhomocysteine deaminase n=1 Tax=Thermodesulfovibrio aggregans TaxID=86166 RepID=A0A0U9HQH6_9BACT|nr:amidohydrolase family protein [Thermodesulfovibrio aggregans]GAQ93978.1 5-methylthioadenosine/S-adenosylhomocysteine deaminase [Thermodesulfovibrio aggregans]